MYLDVDEVLGLADDYGWELVEHNEYSYVLIFSRGKQRVNVYYTTGTVGTCLDHPRKGKTQLFRRNRDLEDLERIFHDIRVHTGFGYYRKQFFHRLGPDNREPLKAR